MSIVNLEPPDLRFRPGCIHLAGMGPGPKCHQLQSLFEPLIKELLKGWVVGFWVFDAAWMPSDIHRGMPSAWFFCRVKLILISAISVKPVLSKKFAYFTPMPLLLCISL